MVQIGNFNVVFLKIAAVKISFLFKKSVYHKEFAEAAGFCLWFFLADGFCFHCTSLSLFKKGNKTDFTPFFFLAINTYWPPPHHCMHRLTAQTAQASFMNHVWSEFSIKLFYYTPSVCAERTASSCCLCHKAKHQKSATKVCYLNVPGQTFWRVLHSGPRSDDTQPECEHPTSHAPHRGPGAPQPLCRQGGLSQQPGAVWLVALAGAPHQRRRWAFPSVWDVCFQPGCLVCVRGWAPPMKWGKVKAVLSGYWLKSKSPPTPAVYNNPLDRSYTVTDMVDTLVFYLYLSILHIKTFLNVALFSLELDLSGT